MRDANRNAVILIRHVTANGIKHLVFKERSRFTARERLREKTFCVFWRCRRDERESRDMLIPRAEVGRKFLPAAVIPSHDDSHDKRHRRCSRITEAPRGGAIYVVNRQSEKGAITQLNDRMITR